MRPFERFRFLAVLFAAPAKNSLKCMSANLKSQKTNLKFPGITRNGSFYKLINHQSEIINLPASSFRL
jgi:hypothetical protein